MRSLYCSRGVSSRSLERQKRGRSGAQEIVADRLKGDEQPVVLRSHKSRTSWCQTSYCAPVLRDHPQERSRPLSAEKNIQA